MAKTVNLGGKDRPVVYNLNAIIELDELTGIDLSSGTDTALMTKPKTIRALAYCGLKHGAIDAGVEVDFKLEDVGKWITVGDNTTMVQLYKIFNSQSDIETKPENKEGAEPKK